MNHPPSGLPTPFLTRSWLVIPPVEEAAVNAGLKSGADVLLFDFSVLPEAERRLAAEHLRDQFTEMPDRDKGPALFVGLPALRESTEDLLSDLLQLKPRGVMLMEMQHRADLQALDVMLTAEEAAMGLPEGVTRTGALVAQAMGLSLVGLSRRFVALGWSADQLILATGAKRMHDADGLLTDAFRMARASVLLAASAAGVEALDAASGLFSTDRLARDCKEAAADGFTGKLAFSPRQVTAINHGFLPDDEEIRQARAAVLGNEQNALLRLRAERILKRADPQKG